MAKGIRERHARSCRSHGGGRCDCTPTVQANIWNPAEGKQVYRRFDSRAEADRWLADAKIAVRRGRRLEQPKVTLQEACEQWLRNARRGSVRTRSGDTYKPAALRSYTTALHKRVYPDLGQEPLVDIRKADLQAIVDQLVSDGLSASTVLTPITALKAVHRNQLDRDLVKDNPTRDLRMPAVRGSRDRIASPEEARTLLAALPALERPIWATAFHAGLRRGELRALRAQAIDLEANEIHVLAGWDAIEGEQPTKGRERRRVWMIPELRTVLAAHLMATGRRDGDLVFGDTAGVPFSPSKLSKSADKVWKDAGLRRITLHECRHTFASIAIAAGVNIGAVSIAMGHASVKITWDRYHHLMPGTMDQAAELVQSYIERPAADAL